MSNERHRKMHSSKCRLGRADRGSDLEQEKRRQRLLQDSHDMVMWCFFLNSMDYRATSKLSTKTHGRKNRLSTNVIFLRRKTSSTLWLRYRCGPKPLFWLRLKRNWKTLSEDYVSMYINIFTRPCIFNEVRCPAGQNKVIISGLH